ncbi:MAG: tail fiber assembly protein, partial [Pelagibacteraceae bacterium]
MTRSYVVNIEEATGLITYVHSFKPVNPPEGVENGFRTKYIIDTALDTHTLLDDWVLTHTYDSTTDSFVERPSPLNDFSTWNISTLAWEWTEEELLLRVRNHRQRLLAPTDWTQLPDAPLTSEQVTEAQTYRQALRDVPAQAIGNHTSFPTVESLTWPTPPSW